MASIEWLSLNKVRSLTGVSMPSLVKYKRTEAHEDGRLSGMYRGEGRGMRFSPSALAVFLELRDEGLEKRGKRHESKED